MKITTQVLDYLQENNLQVESAISLRNYVGSRASSSIMYVTQFVLDVVQETAVPGSFERYETHIYKALKSFPNLHTTGWSFTGKFDDLKQTIKELFEHFGINENVETFLEDSGVTEGNNNGCIIALSYFRIYHLG